MRVRVDRLLQGCGVCVVMPPAGSLARQPESAGLNLEEFVGGVPGGPAWVAGQVGDAWVGADPGGQDTQSVGAGAMGVGFCDRPDEVGVREGLGVGGHPLGAEQVVGEFPDIRGGGGACGFAWVREGARGPAPVPLIRSSWGQAGAEGPEALAHRPGGGFARVRGGVRGFALVRGGSNSGEWVRPCSVARAHQSQRPGAS
ncbi:MAG: hypothetical protein U0Y82_09560 [Thermoleophilia bacterium]